MDSDKTRQNQLNSIQQHYPNLTIVTAKRFNQEGQYNDILLVNDALIFRFPRFADSIPQMRYEVALLQKLQGQTSLPIPNPIFTFLESEVVGEVFMGYEKIAGISLQRNTVNHKSLQQMAEQLAQFMRELHTVPIANWAHDFPEFDTSSEWQDMLIEFRHHLFPHLPPHAQKRVEANFAKFLESSMSQFDPCVRHGDFGAGNILYEPTTGDITGVIDFGFAGIGDPALDLAAVSTFGDPFIQPMFNIYPELAHMQARVRFYRSTYPPQAALYGIKNGDDAEFQSGMANFLATLER